MEMQQVAIWDTKAGAFLPPFVVRQDAIAVRWFAEQMANPASEFAKFPGDYTLVNLGIWDDETGSTISHTAPKALMTGLAAKAAIEAGKTGA